MLYINDQLLHVQQAQKLHTRYLTCYLNRKVYGKTRSCTDAKCKICTSKTQKTSVSPYLLSVLNQIDFGKLVGSTPKTLLNIQRMFNRVYHKSRRKISPRDQKSIGRIFNYDWLLDNPFYDAYELCNNLKIESCVYCNRLYTSTVITSKKEQIIRPTLDHWFAQMHYPILCLSFYNLIPSCSPCNSSVKHMADFSLTKNTHPYIDRKITLGYQFASVYDKSLNRFKLDINTTDKKIQLTLDQMKIRDIYEHHQSELADLDFIKRKYNKKYLTGLGALLGVKLSEKDAYRILFGVEYDDDNFANRPLSKLKKDLLKFNLR